MTEVPAKYLVGTVSEAEFQRTVIELAHTYGWLVHAERPARTAQGWRTPIQGDAGFPDLVLVRGRRLIVAELKTEKGKLSGDQWRWVNYLSSVLDGPYRRLCIWRPSDLEAIEEVLR